MATKTLILITVAILSSTLSPIEAISFAAEPKEPQCTSQGLTCEDCWTSLNCVDLGNGEFLAQLQTCPIGKSCKNSTGLCEDTGTYDCSNTEKVQCHTEGTYPDPYDCKKYFICVRGNNNTLEKHVGECSGSYSFDPYRKQCSNKSIDNERCTSPVPVCSNETQMGQVIGNPSIFYQCVRDDVTIGYNYVPHLYSCSNNFQFNGTGCIDPTPNGVDENGKCIEKNTFGNPNNCQSYTICAETGSVPDVRNCTVSQRFDVIRKTCVSFSCASCHAPF